MVVLAYPMLHTKFQRHRLFGSGEDVFYVLPYMAACCSCDPDQLNNLSFLKAWRQHMKCGSVVLEEKSGDERRTIDDGACFYSSAHVSYITKRLKKNIDMEKSYPYEFWNMMLKR